MNCIVSNRSTNYIINLWIILEMQVNISVGSVKLPNDMAEHQPEHRPDVPRRDVGLPANVNTTVWHLLSTLAEARP